MTNKIHDFELHSVQANMFGRKNVRLEGYETEISKLISLWELFGRAEYNTLYKERLGGPAHITDLTNDQRNMVFCSFDTEELIDGWYALKSFTFLPVAGRIDWFPYRITLVFIGTHAMYQQFYGVVDQQAVTNDWSI